MAVFKQIACITKLFSSLKLSTPLGYNVHNYVRCPKPNVHQIHTSATRNDLMEFFDDKKNWTEKEVKVGRSWKLDELRIKSNGDLHKLWYILLKEKNMLLTMEHACKENFVAFPNPERIDKVEESMENLEKVVRERNQAYYLLEVGNTGERPYRKEVAFTGLNYRYNLRQHRIPEELNPKHKNFKQMLNRMDDKKAQENFLSLYREQRWAERRKKRNREFNHVCGLLKRFPNMDLEAVRQQYPDVDLDKAMKSRRIRGHRADNLV